MNPMKIAQKRTLLWIGFMLVVLTLSIALIRPPNEPVPFDAIKSREVNMAHAIRVFVIFSIEILVECIGFILIWLHAHRQVRINSQLVSHS